MYFRLEHAARVIPHRYLWVHLLSVMGDSLLNCGSRKPPTITIDVAEKPNNKEGGRGKELFSFRVARRMNYF